MSSTIPKKPDPEPVAVTDEDAAESERLPRSLPSKRPGPPGGKRDENRRRRTRELCDAGLDLFLEKGIEGVTIDDIVRAAGVAKGSFYRYFEDKADLVEAIVSPLAAQVDDAFREGQAALEKASSNRRLFAAYQLLAEKLAGAIFLQPLVVKLYLQEMRTPSAGARAPIHALATRIADEAVSLTATARTHALWRPVHPRVSALAVVGSVEKLLFAFLSGEDLGELAEIPDALISMILDGLRLKD